MASCKGGSLQEAESSNGYRQKKVGIVGAGLSGILATKYLLSIGLKPIVFEAKQGIGGVWRETFASTKLQTPRPAYQFTDFLWPSHVTALLPNHSQVMDYFNRYANHFGLLDCIQFNTKVVEIRYSGKESGASAGLWGKNGGPYDDGEVWEVGVHKSNGESIEIGDDRLFVYFYGGRMSEKGSSFRRAEKAQVSCSRVNASCYFAELASVPEISLFPKMGMITRMDLGFLFTLPLDLQTAVPACRRDVYRRCVDRFRWNVKQSRAAVRGSVTKGGQ